MKSPITIIIITMALALCLSWAQSGWTGTDMPWMPYRDTNHIHNIRTYDIDTLTMERKLVSTIEYDRHVYQDTTYFRQQIGRTRCPLHRARNRILGINNIETM